MARHSIVIILVAGLAASGCKGDTVVKPDPQTQADLDQCRKNLGDKDKLIRAEEEENARLLREKGSASEIVVSIEGNALTVKSGLGGGSGHPPPMDDKAAAAASKQFLDVVERSRGSIQKCYQKVLKSNANLQAKTVTLTVSASFANSGAYREASFAPSLGDAFDTCMKTIASKWALPTNSPAMRFQAQVSLTPS